jgi:hypothetical protein
MSTIVGRTMRRLVPGRIERAPTRSDRRFLGSPDEPCSLPGMNQRRSGFSERSVCADNLICDTFSVVNVWTRYRGWLGDSLPPAILLNHSVVEGFRDRSSDSRVRGSDQVAGFPAVHMSEFTTGLETEVSFRSDLRRGLRETASPRPSRGRLVADSL